MHAPALLIVDMQQGLDDPRWGKRNNPGMEKNIVRLLDAWRDAGRTVVHIQHSSTDPDSPLRPGVAGWRFKPEVEPMPNEVQFQKSVNSAFIGTGLREWLRQQDIDSLVIVGLTTDHCVSTTARMAGNLGFDVTLVADATATFDRRGYDGEPHTAEAIHAVHLASLNGEFCKVVRTSDVIESWPEP